MSGPWEDYKAKNESPPWEDYANTEPKKKPDFDLGVALKTQAANLGNLGDTALSTLAGSAAAIFGDKEEALRIDEEMRRRREMRNKWAGREATFPEKVVGAGLTLPFQIAGMGLSPAETAFQAKDAGESNVDALKAAGIDALGNAIGVAVPGFKQGSMAVRAGTGFGVNAAQDYATKAAIQSVLETEEGKRRFEPTLEDAAVSGVVGGGLGVALGRNVPKSEAPRINEIKAAFEATPKETPKPVQEPVKNLTALEGADKQMSLWDIDESVQARHPYQAEFGDWRVDENGIPIRADLSMEAQFDQTPLQRDMFVDANGNFAKMQDTGYYDKTGQLIETPTKSMQQAMDDMTWIAKRGALKKSGLMKGEMEADGSLKAAAIEAELTSPETRSGNPSLKPLPFNYKKQGGAIDPEVFREGYRKFTQSLSNLTDKLAQDPVWQTKIKLSLGGDYMKNSDGSPMVMLHGTTRNIVGDVKTQSQGFHAGFTSSPHMFVQSFGDINNKSLFKTSRTKSNAQLHPIVLKKGNYPYLPLDSGDWTPDRVLEAGTESRRAITQMFLEKGFEPSQIDSLFNYVFNTPNDPKLKNQAFSDILKRIDVDGFFYQNRAESVRTDQLTGYGTRPYRDFNSPRITSYNHPTSFVTWNDKNFTSLYDTEPSKSKFVPKSQRGGLYMGMGKDAKSAELLSKIPGIKKALKGVFPDLQKTTEQVIEESKAIGEKDVSQNLLQKGINWFTKGALYQAQKTGNLLIQHTAHTWLNADRVARGLVQEYIQQGLAPAYRALSKTEATEVGQILNLADLNPTRELTPEFLDGLGLSQKQKAAIQAHQKTMDAAFNAINEARAAAGKEPIDRRRAYAAMRATGDYKRLVYQMVDGEKVVVGIVGSDFRVKTNRLAKQLEAKGYIVGEERQTRFGNTRGGKAAVMQLMEHLADNNPASKDFLDIIAQIDQENAYNYLNAKKHTLEKKGIFGMEGRKDWESPETNAKELLTAQLIYAENAFRWAELSKAMAETKKILSSDLDQPNAKEWIQRYTDNALGINPSKVGQAFESGIHQAMQASGIGPSNFGRLAQSSKWLINTILLSWNPLFIAANAMQPLVATPGMASFLASKGIDSAALGVADMGKANITIAKQKLSPTKLTAVEKGAFDYAKTHAVYQAELVDTSTRASKDAIYYADKAVTFPTTQLEMYSRLLIYMANVHKLSDAGFTAKDGLYQAAHNLTDMTLTNYSKQERPQAFNALGLVGELGVNLQAFKFNELSKLAMFVRAAKEDKNLMPAVTQLMMYIVAAGVVGIPAFQELDTLYTEITKQLYKEPRSLTLDVIEASGAIANKVNTATGDPNSMHPNLLSHGTFASLGGDMSKRLGMGDILPNSVLDTVFPGFSKLVAITGAGYDLAKDPSEFNAKNLVREATPIGLTGPMDRAWFSTTTPEGEMGFSRKDPSKPGPIRTEEDKFWKSIGGTGINESVGKQKLWELTRIDTEYKQSRDKAVAGMIKASRTNSDMTEYINKYLEMQGDPQTLESTLKTKLEKGSISPITAAKIKAATAKTRPDVFKAQRTVEAFN